MSLALKPNTLPADATVPTSPQRLLNWLVQNLTIKGADGTTFFVVQEGTPNIADRDKLWVKLDNLGTPLGIYRYVGAWTRILSYTQVGATAGRPVGAEEGQTYYDTEIGCEIIFISGAWRTVDGVSGDTKLLRAASLNDALTANPGWVEDGDYAADTGTTLGAGVYALKKS